MSQEGVFGMDYLQGYIKHYADTLSIGQIDFRKKEMLVQRKGDPDDVYFGISYLPTPHSAEFKLRLTIQVMSKDHSTYFIYRRVVDQENTLDGLKHIVRQLEIHFGETIRPERFPDRNLIIRADKITKERIADKRGRVELVFHDDDIGHKWSYVIFDTHTNTLLVDNLATDLPDHTYYQFFMNSGAHYRYGMEQAMVTALELQVAAAAETLRLRPQQYHEALIRRFLEHCPGLVEKLYQEQIEPNNRPIKFIN